MQNLLVALDGSAFAEGALPVATRIAKGVHARLVLLAVHEPALPQHAEQGVPSLDRRIDAEARASLRSYLRALQQQLIDEEQLSVDSLVLEGDPSEQIAAYAERTDMDLVTVASHGRGGLSRYWLGSVTDGLLRRLHAPVLVVRPAEGTQERGAEFRRILVPLDGTVGAERILDPLLAIAGIDHPDYTLLTVIPPLNRLLLAFTSEDEAERENTRQLEVAERYLTRVTQRLVGRGAHATCEVRVGLDTAREILAMGREIDASLVAICTHASGPLERALIGSVADKVLRGSSCPVLLQRIPREPPHEPQGLRVADRSLIGQPTVLIPT